MTTDMALIEKREELKRRLAAGEYKTLVDVFLAWANRAIQKTIRRSKPLSLGSISVILIFIFVLVGFGVTYIAGDWDIMLRIADLFGIGYGLGFVLLIAQVTITIAIVIVINQFLSRIFVLWRDQVLDATESAKSLQEFENWLKKTSNHRLHTWIAILGGLLSSLFVVYITSNQLGTFAGYGYTLAVISVNMFNAGFAYQFWMVILLLTIVRQYDLKLFPTDPSSSELIFRLSNELSFFVYFIAVYAAISTLVNALSGFLQLSGFFLVLLLWPPIITVFILNQMSLSRLIRRAKWKTLNEVQAKIERLQASKSFGSPKTIDAIRHLMDYHDRVRATRDSALDFGAYLGFFNSLLLPLLGFILGNLDVVLDFFAKKP